jgi:hypothetical protein
VVEVIAQLREPVAVPQRVQPLGDGDVEPAAGPRRQGEELLAVVRLGLTAPEPRVSSFRVSGGSSSGGGAWPIVQTAVGASAVESAARIALTIARRSDTDRHIVLDRLLRSEPPPA